jgi:cyclase
MHEDPRVTPPVDSRQATPSRRQALAWTIAAGGALLPLSALGQTAGAATGVPRWRTEFRELAPGVYAFVRDGGPGFDNGQRSNAGLVVGPGESLLIDSLGPPVHAKELRAAVLRTTDKPVTRIVHTHFHRDHTNGDYLWDKAEIVTTEVGRKLLIDQGIPAHPYDNHPDWQAGMSELRFVPATTTIGGPVSYWYGEREVRLLTPSPAHTAGDILVYLPKEKILFAGDIAFFYVTPSDFGGYVSTWLKTIDEILAMDVETIVPGHGPIGGKRELADLAGYLRLVQSEVRRGYDARRSPAQAAAAVRLGRYADWPNSDRLLSTAVRLYAEWNGDARPEGDNAAQAAAQKEYAAIVAARR